MCVRAVRVGVIHGDCDVDGAGRLGRAQGLDELTGARALVELIVVFGLDPFGGAGARRDAHFVEFPVPRVTPGLLDGMVTVPDPELLPGALDAAAPGSRGAVRLAIDVLAHRGPIVGGHDVMPGRRSRQRTVAPDGGRVARELEIKTTGRQELNPVAVRPAVLHEDPVRACIRTVVLDPCLESDRASGQIKADVCRDLFREDLVETRGSADVVELSGDPVGRAEGG